MVMVQKIMLNHETEDGSHWFAAVEAQGEGILLTFDNLESTGLRMNGERWISGNQGLDEFIQNGVEKPFMFRGLRSEEFGHFDTLDLDGKSSAITKAIRCSCGGIHLLIT